MGSGREYTRHQLKIIEKYYRTAEDRGIQNLQEIATELFLAESDRKRKELWDRARKSLAVLGMKPKMIDHIVSSARPEILAAHVKDLLARK